MKSKNHLFIIAFSIVMILLCYIAFQIGLRWSEKMNKENAEKLELIVDYLDDHPCYTSRYIDAVNDSTYVNIDTISRLWAKPSERYYLRDGSNNK